jgi:hypothetical protein
MNKYGEIRRSSHFQVKFVAIYYPTRRHSAGSRYGEPNAVTNTLGYATFRSRSYDAVIRVYDEASNVIETQEQAMTKRGQ